MKKKTHWKRLSLLFVLCCWPLALLAEGDLVIEDAEIRMVPPGQKMTAAFMTFRNDTDEAWILSSVTTLIASRAEIHETQIEGDKVSMRKVDHLIIPAGESVVLAPGGLHVMLMGLNSPLKHDDEVEMIFMFIDEDGEELELISVPVTVKDPRSR